MSAGHICSLHLYTDGSQANGLLSFHLFRVSHSCSHPHIATTTAPLDLQFRRSALVVTNDDHHVLGILSSSDIVKYLNQHDGLPSQLLVDDLMTHGVISCDATEKVERLEQLMIEHHLRHIPVTHEGKLCAVVNILDIVRFRMQYAEKEAGQLRDYVSGAA